MGGTFYIHDIPQLDNLSDRELLILSINTINEIKVNLVLQNSRIRSLEVWRYTLAGGMGIVGVLGAWILSKLP